MLVVSLAGLLAFSGVFFLNSVEAEEEEVQQCYNGWVKFGSSCYGFGDEYVSWAGASSLCQIFDGALAEIETAEENEFLKNHSRTKRYHSLWVGATDIFSEGYWFWAGSKNPVSGGSFSDWAVGEPNQLWNSEDCMQLYRLHDYAWSDENCDHNSPFVCEVHLE